MKLTKKKNQIIIKQFKSKIMTKNLNCQAKDLNKRKFYQLNTTNKLKLKIIYQK